MCPALGQGYFMGSLDSVAQKFGRASTSRSAPQYSGATGDGAALAPITGQIGK